MRLVTCPLLLLLLATLLTNVRAQDPNQKGTSSTINLPGKLGQILQNKPIESDSSSFQLRPDGGFDFSWNPAKKKGVITSPPPPKKKPANTLTQSTNNKSIIWPNTIVTNLAMMGSLSCWLYASWIALMTPHPNPQVAATLPLRHDILTFSQAVAFQVPIIVAAFTSLKQNTKAAVLDLTLHRRLLLGIGTMSLWTGAGVFYGKTFSRGYELFSNNIRHAIGGIELVIALWALGSWARWVHFERIIGRLLRGPIGSFLSLLSPGTNQPLDNPEDDTASDIALYTASTMGLLALAVLPQWTSFPTATIPTILGKRFSRAASGITFLASVMAYCVRDASIQGTSSKSIQTLRTGLAIGSIGHLFLVVGKLVGIDGGGLLLEGNGLWEFYPSMVNAARAVTSLMLITFVTTAYVCTR